MKTKQTTYQRILLDGKGYVVIAEEEFQALTQPNKSANRMDELEAFNVSDQRLADRLLQRRRESGLTQKDLAYRAGIRVETLNRIEKGRTTPDFKSIRKLVIAMNNCIGTNQEVHHDSSSNQYDNRSGRRNYRDPGRIS